MSKTTVTTRARVNQDINALINSHVAAVIEADNSKRQAEGMLVAGRKSLCQSVLVTWKLAPKIDSKLFDEVYKALMLKAFVASGQYTEKSIGVRLISFKVAIIAITHSLLPIADETFDEFVKRIRPELVKADLYAATNKGRPAKEAKTTTKGHAASVDVSSLSREGIAAFLVNGDAADALVVATLAEPKFLPMLRALYIQLVPAK